MAPEGKENPGGWELKFRVWLRAVNIRYFLKLYGFSEEALKNENEFLPGTEE
jgi:hypothetical protein